MLSGARRFDVLVAGAGVFGAWAALHFQRAGLATLLVDAFGPGNSRASSGGESRILRMGYGPDAHYTRWALQSRPQWLELSDRAGGTLFHRTGVLWIARDEDPYRDQTLETLRACGVEVDELDRTALASRYPQVRFEPGERGLHEPAGGMILARQAVQAAVREAIRRGVVYRPGGVLAPAGRGRIASVRTTDGSTLAAGQFVYACGSWLAKVFPELLGSRIRSTRQEVFFFGVDPGDDRFCARRLPAWVDFTLGAYGGPDLESRGLKIGLDRHGPPMDPDTTERIVSPECTAEARAILARRFPDLVHAPIVETRVCQYANTSSGDLLIDRHPDFENVWLTGGGSGHGFKHGPAVGEYVRDLILGRARVEPRLSLTTKDTAHARSVY